MSEGDPKLIIPNSTLLKVDNEANYGALIEQIVLLVGLTIASGQANSPFDLSKDIKYCYHVDYYLAQVNNGGHSQFIRNAGENLARISPDISCGLEEIGAHAQLSIFERMLDWIETNNNYLELIRNNREVEFLDQLDDKFYQAERFSPIDPLAAKWIRNWPTLIILPDEEYEAAIRNIFSEKAIQTMLKRRLLHFV